jgi:tRNA (guanine-N7-)-methyltransferase
MNPRHKNNEENLASSPGANILRVHDITKPLEFDLTRPLEIEVGCGKGRFLVSRAKQNQDCDFLGIERMLERVRLFDGKCRREGISNAKVLRLEALYTFHYLLPDHHARKVYVFFPDPWPKKKHHSHRLFGPLFLNALWKRLEIGGVIEFATDHAEYFETVKECFSLDKRFESVEPMPRPKEVWTEFETMFREQSLPIYSAAWRTLEADDAPLEPLTIPSEAEPREGILRRTSAKMEKMENI